MTTSLPRRPGPTVRVRVVELAGQSERRHEDRVATEEPLEIRISAPGRPAERAWVTMRTPGHDFELAAGWARHEGLIVQQQDVRRVAYCTDTSLAPEQEFNVVTIDLAVPVPSFHRHAGAAGVGAGSACGVCGKDSIDAVLDVAGSHAPRPEPPGVDVVRRLPDLLAERQSVFARTGGVHAAGLCDAEGRLVVVREDVGRHNAVDKVTGAQVLVGAEPASPALVVSGRAGFELVQKAVTAGHGALVAVGAPTSLAVDLATRSGLALFGFTKGDRTVRYA